MIAKVLNDNNIYYSPVFAVYYNHCDPKAIILNNTFSELIVIDIWKNDKFSILFTDYNYDNFSIKEDSFKSYWNDKHIFKTIKNKKYTQEMLEEAIEISKNITPQEFTKIKNNFDIEVFKINTNSLHDGYILGMKGKDDALEILFDSSWGSLVLFRCKGIIKNELYIGNVFFHCDINIEEDGSITLTADPSSHNKESVLQAKEIEFKSLFIKSIFLKNLNYETSNNKLTINLNNQIISIDKVSTLLDFKERNVLGYFQSDKNINRFFIFSDEIVYSFLKYNIINKNALNDFKQQCENFGFYFDDYPVDEYIEFYEYDYGELVYSQKCKSFLNLYITFIFLSFHILFWILFCLNRSANWLVYLTMSLATLFILFINKKFILYDKLDIYKKGIKYRGYYGNFDIEYKNISQIKYYKKIYIYSDSVRFTLPKAKNNKYIYDLISEKINNANKADNI